MLRYISLLQYVPYAVSFAYFRVAKNRIADGETRIRNPWITNPVL